jgi:aspartokinase-like uncharacterized kinase
MFKVIDNKILFRDEVVGVLDQEKRASLIEDVVRELEGHTSLDEMEMVIEKMGRLERELFEADATIFRDARWQ